MADDLPADLAYARRLWEQAVTWYRNADTKAQIILTLTGTLIGFVSALVFGTDTDDLVAAFSAITWISVTVFAVAAVLALVAAIRVLVPQTVLKRVRDRQVPSGKLPALWLWRFDLIAAQNEAHFEAGLADLDATRETAALAAHAHQLATSGIAKHRLVAFGFLFLAIAVLALGVGAASFALAA